MWFDHLRGAQLNESNAKLIAEWAKGEVVRIQRNGKLIPVVIVHTPRGQVLIDQGDWVALDEDDRFRILRLEDIDLRSLLKRKPTPNSTVLAVGTPRKG